MVEMSPKLLRRALIALFLVAAGFTTFYAVRAINDAIYWSQHKDDPIEGWMTIGFVAHSYHVPPHILHQALDLPFHPPDKRSLNQIAASKGKSIDEIADKLNDAIVHVRPPYPPPGPPPKPEDEKSGHNN